MARSSKTSPSAGTRPELLAFEERCLERAAAAVPDPGAIATVAFVRGQVDAAAPGTALIASWWCAGEGESHPMLPNPWDEREGIALYESLAYELRLSLTERLTRTLNAIHGTTRSIVYWDLLFGPWLADTVGVLLDRRLLCLMAHSAAPEAELLLLAPGPPPASMAEGLAMYVDEVGNARVLALVAEALGLPCHERAGERDPALTTPPAVRRLHRAIADPAHVPRKAVAVAVHSLLKRRLGRRVLLLGNVQLSGLHALRLAARVGGLRWLPSAMRYDEWLPKGIVPSPEMRAALAAGLDGCDGVERVMAEALVPLFPLSMLEGYGELAEAARQSLGEPCPVVIAGYQIDELQNEFLGRCCESGAGMAFAQHGGGYRQFAVNPVERLELRADATFVSWGWEGPGALSLPSPYLSRLRDSHRGGDAVTIVEVVYYLTVVRLASVPLGDQVAALSRLLADFAEAVVDPEVSRNLALKRYVASYAAAVPSDARLARLDSARFPSPRATDWMRSSRLAVVAYPDTSFIEAMTMNVPTIGLWHQALWELRDDAAAPFERLAELGVIQSDPAAAAARVEEVYRDASGWWAGAEIQEARLAFLQRFGRTGDWLGPWATFLNELSR